MTWPFICNFRLSGEGGKFRGKLVVASGRKSYIHGKTGRGFTLEEFLVAARQANHLGDHTTNEDALRGAGISIAAGGGPEADYYLKTLGGVHEFPELPARTPSPGGKLKRASNGGKGCRQRRTEMFRKLKQG